MTNLIIEGVAGTGKTSVIDCLKKDPILKSAFFISEDETLGELFTELRDKSISPRQHVKRLEAVLSGLVDKSRIIVLERFHHSYYALGIDWALLKAIDERLYNLNFKTALLDLPVSEFMMRSLMRQERENDGWQKGFTELYGSAEKAVEAFSNSQQKRKDALRLSILQNRTFDTSSTDWIQISQAIAAFSGGE